MYPASISSSKVYICFVEGDKQPEINKSNQHFRSYHNNDKDENHDCNNKEESTTDESNDGKQDEQEQDTSTTKSPSSISSSTFTLEYRTSQQLQNKEEPVLSQRLLELFECNMKGYYETSAWGYNPKSKLGEFQHANAKFLLLYEHPTNGTNETTKTLIGFVHFRYEWDDEEYPTEPVLYVYELQIDPNYQRSKVQRARSSRGSRSTSTSTGKDSTKKAATKNNVIGTEGDSIRGGFGTYIMLLLEKMAANSDENIRKIVLTCFKSNTQAMDFYLKKLSYVIDDNSPSKHNDPTVDYEILSKTIPTT